MLCNGKLKIEAVYRNELMDDIINIVTGIKQILEMLKWLNIVLNFVSITTISKSLANLKAIVSRIFAFTLVKVTLFKFQI